MALPSNPSLILSRCSSSNRILLNNPSPKSPTFNHKPLKIQPFFLKAIKSHTPKTTSFSNSDSYPDEELRISSSGHVSVRLRELVSEFRLLSEPIDRVKRLLDYAGVLPRLGESTRSPENRVPGCAAQVWLEVEMDEIGRMRFGADSDSEITKGFCSCLIFLLNGAFPDDIFKLKAEDLVDMNVGLPVRSRVNSWHNVMVNMQERTRSLVTQREEEEMSQLEPSRSDRLLIAECCCL